MSYFGNVSSFPCLEFTAAFSRNQALFDARNDFPLFPQSTASHFGHFAETFPISPGIPAIRTRPRPNAHVIGSQCAHWHGNPLVLPRSIEESTGAGAPRLPCVKGAVMAVSRKAMTEGLSKCGNSDPLSLVLAGDARDSSPWSARGAGVLPHQCVFRLFNAICYPTYTGKSTLPFIHCNTLPGAKPPNSSTQFYGK